jgi:hypothetical protein
MDFCVPDCLCACYFLCVQPISVSEAMERKILILFCRGSQFAGRMRTVDVSFAAGIVYIFVILCNTVILYDWKYWTDITKLSVWWPEDKNSPNVAHACRKRRLKWVPSAWRYSWVTLSPGVTNAEAWSPGWGLGVGLTAPPRKNPVVRKSKEENASEEGYGS